MADKGALEFIGMMLLAATLFVVGLGGFAVRHQLATESGIDAAGSPAIEIAQLPGAMTTVQAGMRPTILK